jgi:hypothetical protein
MASNVFSSWDRLRTSCDRRLQTVKQYLKPSFSNYWGNWVFIVAVFFLSFFSASVLASDTYYRVMPSSTPYYGLTPESACSAAGGVVSSVSGKCNIDSLGSYSITTLQCPYGYEFSEELGQCVVPPSNDCPTGLTRVTYKYIDTISDSSPVNTGSCTKQIDGCVYNECGIASVDGYDDLHDPNDNYPECHRVEGGNENEVVCTVSSVLQGTGQTVEESQLGEADLQEAVEEGDDALSDLGLEDEAVTDTTVETTTTTTSDPVTITDEETGASSTTQTTQTVTTKGDGVTVKETTDTVQTTNTDGITKTVTTTTTTTTHADGSSTTVETTNTEFTNAPVTTCTHSVSSDGVRGLYCSSTTGSTAGSTTTKTTDKDADGNVTSETEKTEGNTDAEEGQENEQSYCEQNPQDVNCYTYTGPSSEGLYQPGEMTLDFVLDNFKGAIEGAPIVNTFSTFFDVNASGSCSGWSTSVWVFDIDFDPCGQLLDTVLLVVGSVLLMLAGLVSFRIAFM